MTTDEQIDEELALKTPAAVGVIGAFIAAISAYFLGGLAASGLAIGCSMVVMSAGALASRRRPTSRPDLAIDLNACTVERHSSAG